MTLYNWLSVLLYIHACIQTFQVYSCMSCVNIGTEYRAGQYDEAVKASVITKRVNIVGIAVGTCLIILLIGTIVVASVIAFQTEIST